MSHDRHYVCEVCAHTWSSPEHPDECENCRRSAVFVVAWDTLENAEDHSQRILDDEAEARAQLAGRRTPNIDAYKRHLTRDD